MWYNNVQVKRKNKSEDNVNYIITFREPKEAGNLVSKNNLLSPNCFQSENFCKNIKINRKQSKFERKSALKINKRMM